MLHVTFELHFTLLFQFIVMDVDIVMDVCCFFTCDLQVFLTRLSVDLLFIYAIN